MTRSRQRSLSARLIRMNLVVSSTVLLLAALGFFFYDLVTFRNNLIHNLDSDAEIVGDSSVSALLFNDPQSAENTLGGLRRSPDVLSAVLTANDGSVFARYGAPDRVGSGSHRLAPGEADRVWLSGTHVFLAHRVIFQDKPVGVVYISAVLEEVGHRARQYFLIACVIVLFCMGAAFFISSMSRRLVEQPIIALAETAVRVSRDQDYSVRARIHTDSREIAILVDAFNTMLTQIEDARTHLEARVEQRTVELRAANRELEAFSYTVAHDLRNPLQAIGSIGYILGETCKTLNDPNVPLLLTQLNATTATMESLINSLLDFARASTEPVKSEPVDLTAIAREVAAELTASEPARAIQVSIAEAPKAIADAALMRVVLDNLLRNAWKYTSHHTQARIEFGAKASPSRGRDAAETIYFVRDDGAGFDPQKADQLFRPFQRLHGKNDFPGTGIGLATVGRILARHGGSIWAEGAVEKGATFYFAVKSE